MLEDLKQSDYPSKRLIIVGSILLYYQCIHNEHFIKDCDIDVLTWTFLYTMNQETQIPWLEMYLGDLRGFAGGLNGLNSSTMIDGGEFDGAKAYKDRILQYAHYTRIPQALL